jgi:hypothetical protein
MHLARLRQALPPRSALPPLLDLSKANDGSPSAGEEWEDRFTGSMGVRPIEDPGVASPEQATSISTTITENGGQIYLLPARSCDLVAIAKVIGVTVHLAYNRRFVYSAYDLHLSEALKVPDKRLKRDGAHVLAAQLGGAIRFHSGHVGAFLEAQEGFMDVGKSYLLFLWKPVRSSEMYIVTQAFLLEEDKVFAITYISEESRYSGTPLVQFMSKVKAVVAKNVDGM